MFRGIDGSPGNQGITDCLNAFADLTLSAATEKTTSTSSSGTMFEEDDPLSSPRRDRLVSRNAQTVFERAVQSISERDAKPEIKLRPIIKATPPESLHTVEELLAFHEKYSFCDEVAEFDVLNAIGWKSDEDVQAAFQRASQRVQNLKVCAPVIVEICYNYFCAFYLGSLVECSPQVVSVQYADTHFEGNTTSLFEPSQVYALREVNPPVKAIPLVSKNVLFNFEKMQQEDRIKKPLVGWDDKRMVRIVRRGEDDTDAPLDADTRAQDSLYSFLLGNQAVHSDLNRYVTIKHGKDSRLTVFRLLTMRKKTDEKLIEAYLKHRQLLKKEGLGDSRKEELRLFEKLYLMELERRGLDAFIEV